MTAGRRAIVAASVLLTGVLGYLLAWPVAVDPVAWEAPADRGMANPFGPDDRLRRLELIDIAPHAGPEDLTIGPDGLLYASTYGGSVIRVWPGNNTVELFAETAGRPLGIEFDGAGRLLVANAYLGLQRITPEGEVETLVDTWDGQPIGYADDVAVARDGSIYFSDASSKFSAKDYGGTYQASLLDIMEHGGHGRVFRFDPDQNEITLQVDGLNFANGVAISEDQRFLLISETGSYRILRHWLAGPRAGHHDVVVDNLPGFPDNINNGLNGRFWIGLVAPRSSALDRLSSQPWLRKVVQRLPQSMRPRAVPSSHAFSINGYGDVLMNLRDPGASLPAVTGVAETRDALWLSSLFGTHIGRLDKRDLAN